MRFALALLVCAVQAGCAAYPPPFGPPDPRATQHLIHVVTTRGPEAIAAQAELFGADRREVLSYGQMRVSVPPDHQPGVIAWPGRHPTAAENFLVTGVLQKDSKADFLRAIPEAEETVLFVHGFNNTVPEAAFQLAQIRHDFKVRVPTVLFAWPSAADVRGYLYDRDSVLFSRNDLARTLRDLTRARGKVLIVAHSMGSLLTMEALRQLALTGDHATLRRISGITLIAPDIDKDLFARQVRTIGTLPQPFVVFVAQTDPALAIAGFLTGRRERLGNVSEASDFSGLPITVVDLTAFGEEVSGTDHHQIALTSPGAISLLRRVLAGDASALDAISPYVLQEGGLADTR
ncbi:MAG: alpha/beta fold hydrolase [Pseudomonadota bacterium]